MKKFTLSIIIGFSWLVLWIPTEAFAHVKWFAYESGYVRPYSITDTPVLIAIIGVIIVVLLGVYLEKRLRVPDKLHNTIQKWAPRVLSLASMGFGLAFIIFTISGFIFAPNLPAEGTLGIIMLILQGVIGVMMLFGFYERAGGILLFVLFTLGILEYGFIEMLDTLEILGFAVYIVIAGRPLWKVTEWTWLRKVTHRIHKYGHPILRVGVGLNLIVLGFTEKILTPSLTNNFLADYHWNFMNIFGMSDYWFSFCAGVTEALVGLFFVLGLITRTTTIILAILLITTLVLLGPTELVGHLPHFSIAVVLLVLGSGSRLLLIKHKDHA